MRRFFLTLFVILLTVFDVSACKKAHNAGNDSMRAPGVAIAVAADRSDARRSASVARGPFGGVWDSAGSDSSQQLGPYRACETRSPKTHAFAGRGPGATDRDALIPQAPKD